MATLCVATAKPGSVRLCNRARRCPLLGYGWCGFTDRNGARCCPTVHDYGHPEGSTLFFKADAAEPRTSGSVVPLPSRKSRHAWQPVRRAERGNGLLVERHPLSRQVASKLVNRALEHIGIVHRPRQYNRALYREYRVFGETMRKRRISTLSNKRCFQSLYPIDKIPPNSFGEAVPRIADCQGADEANAPT